MNPKWRTGFTNAQVTTLERWVKHDIETNENYITDTSVWAFRQFEGKPLFVIYSTNVPSNPTIHYVSKADQALFERDYLIKFLEDIKDESSLFGKSVNIDKVLNGNWLHPFGNVVNNNKSGRRNGSSGNATILQGPPQSGPSRALKTVLNNLIKESEKRELDRLKSETFDNKEKFSIKNSRLDDGESGTTSYEERGVLLRYKSSESYRINAELRENGLDNLGEEDIAFVEQMDSALKKLPKYKGKIYRNLVFDGFAGDEEGYNKFLEKHEPDMIVTYSAYTSASTDEHGYEVDGNHVVHMIVENSQNAHNLEGFGNNSESEVLYERNSVFLSKK